MSDHTLAAGTPVAKRFQGLPGTSQLQVRPPHKAPTILAGEPWTGKTWFAQSIPNSYLLNLDRSSILNPSSEAVVWPVSPDDQLTFNHVREVVDTLIKMPPGRNRPDVIVIDSIAALLALIREWIPANAGTLKIANGPKATWNDLHGPAAYDALYNLAVGIIVGLINAGYGVFAVAHLTNEVIQLGENQNIVRPTFTFTGGFWKRLYFLVENVLVFKSSWGTERSVGPDGRRQSQTVRKYRIVTDDSEYDGIMKTRVPLPTVELDREDPWGSYCNAYNDALTATSAGGGQASDSTQSEADGDSNS